MHPDIAELVAYAGRKSNMSVVTNGFLLRNGVIEALNEAGLNNLTVSVDTLHADPSRYIQKSFRSLKTRLERLQQLAKFDVHVTAVLCESSKDDFRQLMREIETFGFRMSVNLIHNARDISTSQGQPYLRAIRRVLPRGQAVHVPGLRIREEAPPGRESRLEMPRRRPLSVRGRVRQRTAVRVTARPAWQTDPRVHRRRPRRELARPTRVARKAAQSVVRSAAPSLTTTSPQFVKSVIKGS